MHTRMCEHIPQYQENAYVFLFNILGDTVDCMVVVFICCW